MKKAYLKSFSMVILGTCLLVGTAFAQTEEEIAEFARKAQDPLGDVKAITKLAFFQA